MSKPPGTQPTDDDANDITQADILHWVRSYVWSGEYDGEEIALLIEDQLGEGDEVDEGWLCEVIRREVAAKRKAEKTWPKVTDCDRLDRAFQTLERQGIIALHMPGFTQTDGLEEVEDAYCEAGGKKSKYAGHCFYTEQDHGRKRWPQMANVSAPGRRAWEREETKPGEYWTNSAVSRMFFKWCVAKPL